MIFCFSPRIFLFLLFVCILFSKIKFTKIQECSYLFIFKKKKNVSKEKKNIFNILKSFQGKKKPRNENTKCCRFKKKKKKKKKK
jgi:hypothetical protein